MTDPNPFATAPQQAPAMISDAAPQQFGAPPAQPQYSPGPQADYAAPVQHQPSAFAQAAAPELQQMQAQQHQQFAQAPAAPQGLPGQPWSPQQHQQNVPQAYAPPPQASAPAVQQLPQRPFPPTVQQQAAPQFVAPQMPAQPTGPFGGGFDASLFGAPSAGGGGTYPKVRDIEGRLCLIRTKRRDAEGTAYNDSSKKVVNYIANVAVLDGGALYASPNAEDPMAQPELVSETVPYVVSDMIISQVGLHNRLKLDFVRGRIMRHPKGALEKQLLERFPGATPPQALFTALQQGLIQPAQLTSGTYFWTIVEDASPEADQLVAQFAQNPIARELML